ncbi:helix-turn-helix transcriptional regulator [Streptomyces sp. G7(2002)]|uniref:helix-turn-helix transcriptional regulator n=1 Tax=Streptomyces sp. G7(2002) TaxID=2971798 RepID=UPI00237DE5B4|nr:helix-turn-helix transcriptional regulator [Streptomyces sp. G7(2002)]WDT53541.1 helix-turn-helix domain-containing protein [Streptomyces sp. G7(2002)]
MDTLPKHPLAIARDLYGLSQSDLAEGIKQAARRRDRRAGTTKQQVSVWERPGGRPPDAWYQQLIADVFEVDHDRVTALGWPYWLPGHDAPVDLGTGETVAALRKAQRQAMLNRRTLFGLAPAALATLAQQWATLDPALAASAADGQVAPEFVTYLESSVKRLAGMATADRQHSAQILDSYYDTVIGLLEKCRSDRATEERLYTLASSLAQTIGWHRFDHEHHTDAGHYWCAALHAAHHLGDRDRGAGILSDLAYQRIWLDQAGTAIDVLDHALSRTQDATARSLLHLRKARALAMNGDARACRRNLNAAEHALDTATAAPPAWCSWMSPADLAVDSGRCLIDLGETGPALHQITQGVALLPTARDKTRAVFLAYEAESLLRQGEIDHSAATAHEALVLAERIGASRCVRQISDLARGYEPHVKVQGVEQFLSVVRAAA